MVFYFKKNHTTLSLTHISLNNINNKISNDDVGEHEKNTDDCDDN